VSEILCRHRKWQIFVYILANSRDGKYRILNKRDRVIYENHLLMLQLQMGFDKDVNEQPVLGN